MMQGTLREASETGSASKKAPTRDSKFGETVNSAVSDVGLNSVKTSFRSPWQNGVAERWVGSCRRDLLDQVIPVNERHLKPLLSGYSAVTCQ